MVCLFDLMLSAEFDCENIAELLMHEEEIKGSLEIAPIIKAATLGRDSTVKSLLAKGVDARARYGDNHEISALDAAALMGNLEIARALLEHGVDADDVGPNGQTALHHAMFHGRADVRDFIDLLLSAGADIDARTAEGVTPLHLAAFRAGPGGAVSHLLLRGATKDAIESGGASPLHVATRCGNLAATRSLLAAGADATLRTDSQETPLDFAAAHGWVEVVRELAQHGVDLDGFDGLSGSALNNAACQNQAAVVDALVDAGASVNGANLDNEPTPLVCAVVQLGIETMQVLLRRGAPILGSLEHEICRRCPLLHLAAMEAGRERASEAVGLLLRRGADESKLDSDGKTAAEVVGAHGSPEEILKQVAAGLDDREYAYGFAADADRVCELLANAPEDRAWRRRGLLLLCLARHQTTRSRRSSGRWGEGKGKGAEEGTLANRVGDGGRGGSGSAVPSHAAVGMSAATTGRSKREKKMSKVVDGRPRFDGSDGGGNECGNVVGTENRGDFGGAVAMLLDLQQEGFFRTIVGFL